MMNTVVELGPHDEEVRSIIAEVMESMREWLVSVLSQGQEMGAFRKDVTARDMANYLIVVKAGLLSGSKAKLKDQDPFVVAELALSTIEA